MTFEFNASSSGTEVDIAITGVIGDDFWSDEPCTSDSVREALKTAPNAALIRAFIDTDGGDVWQGFGIYQVLSEHSARVEVTIGARAQSCGSLIAMAGDKISMHESSKLLVHNPWGIRVGDADRLEKTAKDLRNLQASFVTAYAAKTGMSEADTQALMNEDRLMDADEAMAKGFCTDVRKAPRKDKGASAMGDKELTDAMSKLRAKALTSARTLQIAAMAPPTPTPDPTPAPSAPEGKQKENHMNPIVLAALSLPEGATDSDILASITQLKASADASNKLVAAIGAKSADEALGTVAALQANLSQVDSAGHTKVLAALDSKNADEALGKIGALMGARERLATAESKLDALGKQAEQSERDEIIAKLEADGKCTPKQVTELFPNLNLAGLKAFAATAVAILKGDGKREAKNGAQKSYADMSNTERAELHASDPELFKQLRAQAQQDGTV